MGLKGRLKHLQKVARGELESFPLLDGTLYFYDCLETAKDLFLHIYDRRLGDDAGALVLRGTRAPRQARAFLRTRRRRLSELLARRARLAQLATIVFSRRPSPVSALPGATTAR